jgi:hypothetical protein
MFGNHLLQCHEEALNTPIHHVWAPMIKQLLSEPQNKDVSWLTMPVPQPDST